MRFILLRNRKGLLTRLLYPKKCLTNFLSFHKLNSKLIIKTMAKTVKRKKATLTSAPKTSKKADLSLVMQIGVVFVIVFGMLLFAYAVKTFSW